MLRAFAYVMALPGVASVTEHYGQNKTELQLIASTGEVHTGSKGIEQDTLTYLGDNGIVQAL